MTGIKICGLVSEADAELVNGFDVRYAGVVMFFPKSKRNTEPWIAERIARALRNGIAPVAVMVEPKAEQLAEAARRGFKFAQIHGAVPRELIESSPLPVIKAFNVNELDTIDVYNGYENIVGYLFDAAEPGSGKTFDWDMIKELNTADRQIFLAGGLNAGNVSAAIRHAAPDVVDVSSGTENDGGIGKSPEKTEAFVRAVFGGI